MNLLEVGLDRLREILGTDPELGLTGEQVLQNRQEFGENVLFEKKNTVSELVRKIFGDVMMILFLLVAFFDYMETGESSSLIALLVTVILYGIFVLGTFVYVTKTKKLLEKYSKSKFHVRRNGGIKKVQKSEIVPGDILVLEKGDVVPCDGIILRHSSLKILEASVTGRRVPVFKRSHEEVSGENSGLPYFECILFAGSVILQGSVKLFVCNTGKNIFDNENATVSRQNTSVPTIYQTAMELKKQISLVWVVASLFILAWGVFYGLEVFHTFYFVSAMIIAAFPDSIEHLCDLALSHMTRRLFSEGIVLRNPGAIDRLCDANCVFINSSEYLFHSHPLPKAFYLGQSFYDFKEKPEKAAPLLEALLLAQSHKAYFAGRPDEWKSERAILSAAASLGIQKTKLDKKVLHINHYDFEPRYGYSCSLVMQDKTYRLIIRGNPSSVLAACDEFYRDGVSVPMNESLRTAIRGQTRHLAGMCERLVAVATLNLSSPSTGDQRALCRGMTYLGMFGLSTPISAASANAVSICQKAGVQSYLLTDDFPETVSALSKSVSIIGKDDYQNALSYGTYERMDRGVFLADLERYKAFCAFPVDEKQNIVKYHKNNGNITVALTSGVLDTLPQMEADISIVGAEEKLNAVRLNADLMLKEKRFELIPLCINWARIFYRNVVHIMQYVLLVQVTLGFSAFIGMTANREVPFPVLPMLLSGILVSIPCGINLFRQTPGPRLEDNRYALKDERVFSLRALIILPFLAGAIQAISVMLARQIAFYATGNSGIAAGAALVAFTMSLCFSSISFKFGDPITRSYKQLGRSDVTVFVIALLVSSFFAFTPLGVHWLFANPAKMLGFWPFLFAIILSLFSAFTLEAMKLLKINDSAKSRDYKNEKGEQL